METRDEVEMYGSPVRVGEWRRRGWMKVTLPTRESADR